MSIQKTEIPIITADQTSNTMTVYVASGTPYASILFFPAMGTEAGRYHRLASSLALKGFRVALCDLRGTGHSSVRASRKQNFGYSEFVQFDLPSFLEAINKIDNQSPCFLMGHSLGGQISACYAALYPERVQNVILIATGSVFFRAYPFPSNIGILVGTQAARLLAEAYGHFPGYKVGFAQREARGVMRDWASQALTGNYNFLGKELCVEEKLRTSKLNLLVISVDGDQLTPRGSVDHLCQKLQNSSIERWHYSVDNSGKNAPGHFRWMKEPTYISEKISLWIHDSLKK